MSRIRLSEHTKFSKVCLFKNSFFGRERKDKKKDFLFAKKARAQFASFYIHASLVHSSCTHNSRANKSFCFCELRARARENRKREREILFFVSVCVCLSAFVSREVWSFKDGRRCGNSR